MIKIAHPEHLLMWAKTSQDMMIIIYRLYKGSPILKLPCGLPFPGGCYSMHLIIRNNNIHVYGLGVGIWKVSEMEWGIPSGDTQSPVGVNECVLSQGTTSKFHGEFMSPTLFLFEVLKMVKLTRGPLVLYHLPKYWSRKPVIKNFKILKNTTCLSSDHP